ncbi:MAG: hypothetical protein Kow0098_03320 [Ignavibacteriaceae bacterium]
MKSLNENYRLAMPQYRYILLEANRMYPGYNAFIQLSLYRNYLNGVLNHASSEERKKAALVMLVNTTCLIQNFFLIDTKPAEPGKIFLDQTEKRLSAIKPLSN